MATSDAPAQLPAAATGDDRNPVSLTVPLLPELTDEELARASGGSCQVGRLVLEGATVRIHPQRCPETRSFKWPLGTTLDELAQAVPPGRYRVSLMDERSRKLADGTVDLEPESVPERAPAIAPPPPAPVHAVPGTQGVLAVTGATPSESLHAVMIQQQQQQLVALMNARLEDAKATTGFFVELAKGGGMQGGDPAVVQSLRDALDDLRRRSRQEANDADEKLRREQKALRAAEDERDDARRELRKVREELAALEAKAKAAPAAAAGAGGGVGDLVAGLVQMLGGPQQLLGFIADFVSQKHGGDMSQLPQLAAAVVPGPN